MTGVARGKPGFNFYLSCDINLQVKVRISDLQGLLPSFKKSFSQDSIAYKPTAAYAVAQLTAADSLLGLETRTTYAEATPSSCVWGEWLTFCVKLAEGCPVALVGGTTMPMFNKKGRLKTGPQRLRIWEQRTPCIKWPSSTPGKAPLKLRGCIGQLEHLVKLFNRGDIPQTSWLDLLTMGEIQDLQQQELQQCLDKQELQLVLDLPSFPHAVLYQQPLSYTAAIQSGGAKEGPAPVLGAALRGEKQHMDSIIVLHDPEVGRENPAELKAQKLARSLTRGVIDRDLKPNSDERRRITAILKMPPNKPLHADEKALLWRFRFSLTQERRALTKFLKCVDWSDVLESKQAVELMQQWATIDIADAMELLSPDFKNEEVRSHAVSVLQQKDDDELLYYLLQLVQALRYESSDHSRLAKFLIHRGTSNPIFAIMLHWYLFTEWEDPTFGSRASSIHSHLVSSLQHSLHGERSWEVIRRQTDMVSQLNYLIKELKSSKLKAARATQRLQEMVSESGPCGELTVLRVPLPLNPSILLDGIVPSECMCFKSAQLPLRLHFRVDPVPVSWKGEPRHLDRTASGALSPSSSSHEAATASSRHMQAVHGRPKASIENFPSRTGLVMQGDTLRCILIYKKGDDLRQDQFILQMISLMDQLLKRENLDLRLTPYKVLPTSSDDGLVEFVPSMPLSKVLSEHRTIHKYLAQYQADATGPFGLKAEALEAFVRSCAGYCVATYILGVGDRHLDNLMLTTDGRLFHIDFGYILGNDPKPFPPPMKICKEMVEAMGGQDSIYYVQFRMYACEAYNILRKSADLILSLFHLMAGASIDAIRSDPEKAMLKLQEKFRLDFDDEQAVEWMQQLINESATALMPQIVETTHRWAQYWR